MTAAAESTTFATTLIEHYVPPLRPSNIEYSVLYKVILKTIQACRAQWRLPCMPLIANASIGGKGGRVIAIEGEHHNA